jgi:hypothetical protein
MRRNFAVWGGGVADPTRTWCKHHKINYIYLLVERLTSAFLINLPKRTVVDLSGLSKIAFIRYSIDSLKIGTSKL